MLPVEQVPVIDVAAQALGDVLDRGSRRVRRVERRRGRHLTTVSGQEQRRPHGHGKGQRAASDVIHMWFDATRHAMVRRLRRSRGR
jgi:hypothetical protein